MLNKLKKMCTVHPFFYQTEQTKSYPEELKVSDSWDELELVQTYLQVLEFNLVFTIQPNV